MCVCVCVCVYLHHDTRVRVVKSVGRATKDSIPKVQGETSWVCDCGRSVLVIVWVIWTLSKPSHSFLEREKTTLSPPWREPGPANQGPGGTIGNDCLRECLGIATDGRVSYQHILIHTYLEDTYS